jgi:hypothetical protein
LAALSKNYLTFAPCYIFKIIKNNIMVILKEQEEQIVNFGVFEYDSLKMSNILDVEEHDIIK